MMKMMSLAASAMLLASAMGAVPANAASMGMGMGMGHPNPGGQQAYVMKWCQNNPKDPSCHDFDQHQHKWSDTQYHDWYNSHHSMHGFDPAAAAIFGITAALGAAVVSSQSDNMHMTHHQRACMAKYGDNYNPSTDQVKFPGHRPHDCDV